MKTHAKGIPFVENYYILLVSEHVTNLRKRRSYYDIFDYKSYEFDSFCHISRVQHSRNRLCWLCFDLDLCVKEASLTPSEYVIVCLPSHMFYLWVITGSSHIWSCIYSLRRCGVLRLAIFTSFWLLTLSSSKHCLEIPTIFTFLLHQEVVTL